LTSVPVADWDSNLITLVSKVLNRETLEAFDKDSHATLQPSDVFRPAIGEHLRLTRT
jgi:hypothetical protein